ncbi:MAG: hypothetical protein Q8L64_02490 [bacterium]|nr:hypothetical protein [bacterium]
MKKTFLLLCLALLLSACGRTVSLSPSAETPVKTLTAKPDLVATLESAPTLNNNMTAQPYEILLINRRFVPPEGVNSSDLIFPLAPIEANTSVSHILIQFYYIPSERERFLLQERGIQLLDYIPNNAWAASVKGAVDQIISDTFTEFPALIRWAGPIQPADKLDAEGYLDLVNSGQDNFNFSVSFFPDVPVELARRILDANGAEIVQEIASAQRFEILLPITQVNELVLYDSVQWVEPIWPKTIN